MALLTADEEKELAYSVADGDHQARDVVVRANLRPAVNIAQDHAGLDFSLDNLSWPRGAPPCWAGRGEYAHLRQILQTSIALLSYQFAWSDSLFNELEVEVYEPNGAVAWATVGQTKQPHGMTRLRSPTARA